MLMRFNYMKLLSNLLLSCYQSSTWTVEEASGVDPSVATNPSGWYRWVLTKHPVCGYCSVLSPFPNTRTPPWIWFRSRNWNDIFESSSIHKLSTAYAPATEVEKDSSAQTKLSLTSDPIVFKKKPINDVAGNISKLKATFTMLIDNISWTWLW